MSQLQPILKQLIAYLWQKGNKVNIQNEKWKIHFMGIAVYVIQQITSFCEKYIWLHIP